jgi:hypothetical protein
MTLARGVGRDLCPRLKELSDRHPFVPRGSEIPVASDQARWITGDTLRVDGGSRL